MVELGGDDRFLQQAGDQIPPLAAGGLLAQAHRLDRHPALEARVVADEDRAHGAGAEELEDLVATEEDLVQRLLVSQPAFERLEGGP